MAYREQRDDIGKYRVLVSDDQFISSKPRSFGCAIGCIGVFVLPLMSYAVLFFSTIFGQASRQTGFLAASLLVFSAAIFLYGFFFGFGRRRILEFRRKSNEVVHNSIELGKISQIEEIIIEFRHIAVKIGSRVVEREQYILLLEPIGKDKPVAFFTKAELAERMARLMSQFVGAPIRNRKGETQSFFTGKQD